MPVHRLDEPPLRRGVLEDITCDSDGRIDCYVERNGLESSLPLQVLRPGEPYLLAVFLVGAYQHHAVLITEVVAVEQIPDGADISPGRRKQPAIMCGL